MGVRDRTTLQIAKNDRLVDMLWPTKSLESPILIIKTTSINPEAQGPDLLALAGEYLQKHFTGFLKTFFMCFVFIMTKKMEKCHESSNINGVNVF